MKSFIFANHQLKSIPLNALPESAWKTIVGAYSGDNAELLDLVEKIPWLSRGRTLRCNALMGLPYSLHEGDENGQEIARSDWPFRLNFSRLVYQLYQDYIVFGRAYCYIDQNLLGGLRNPGGELEPLRRWLPTTIKPEYDPKVGISKFTRILDNKSTDVPTDQIMYWFKPPLRTEVGWDKSDAIAAVEAAGVLDNLNITLDKFWQQGAVNATLITVDGDMQPTDEERIDNWIQKALTGVNNAFRQRFIAGSGKLSSVTLGYPIKDLAAGELTAAKREDIATALGVPHSLLFSNAANFATAQQDTLNFYDHTINPDSTSLEEAMNLKIWNPMGVHLKFHPERMEAYQQAELGKAQNIGILVDKYVLTTREARVSIGYSEEPAEDDPQYDEVAGVKKPKQPVPPQLLQTQQQGTQPVLPPPAQPAETPPTAKALDDLNKWKRMAHKRFTEGNPSKALDFTTDALRPAVQGAIRGALKTAVTPEDVNRIFSHLAPFSEYP